MSKNYINITIGFFIIIFSIFILSTLVRNYNFLKKEDNYKIFASFNDVSGLSIGSYLKISGVNIGQVSEITLDKQSYRVDVSMRIENHIKIPKDSLAVISSLSPLSDVKYINIKPGLEEGFLKENDHIKETQSSLNLEYFLRKLIVN